MIAGLFFWLGGFGGRGVGWRAGTLLDNEGPSWYNWCEMESNTIAVPVHSLGEVPLAKLLFAEFAMLKYESLEREKPSMTPANMKI
jgi:hypothetical protein